MVTQTAGQSLFFQFRVVYIQHCFFYLLKRELPYKFFKHSHVEEATDINCYWNGEKISWSVSSTITSLGLFF